MYLASPANRYDEARMNDYAMRALLMSPISFDESDPSSQEGVEHIEGLTRDFNETHIVYSYPFREFRGNVSSPSETMFLRSSSSCIQKRIDGTAIYEITSNEGEGLRETLVGELGIVPYLLSKPTERPCFGAWVLIICRCVQPQITFHPEVST